MSQIKKQVTIPFDGSMGDYIAWLGAIQCRTHGERPEIHATSDEQVGVTVCCEGLSAEIDQRVAGYEG